MAKHERKFDILYAIIKEYIKTAEPVGSRTLEKKHTLGISSATIRNEMSDLEDMGFLIQPHASAGRIPSEKAYRLYVDNFMQTFELEDSVADKIRSQYQSYFLELNEAVRKTAEILTKITSYTALVSTPEVAALGIKEIRLVSIEAERVFVIVITRQSAVKNAEMRLSFAPTGQQLEAAANFINQFVKTHADAASLSDFREKMGELPLGIQDIVQEVVPALNAIANAGIKTRVFADGLTEILNYPEFQDVSKAKMFIEAMHRRELLAFLLDRAMDAENAVDVKIGTESEIEELSECSVLTATYKLNGQPIGTIGIVGPTRMDYGKCVSVINMLTNELTKHINWSMGGGYEDG
jgi:heat-inducible transcriptional repressor